MIDKITTYFEGKNRQKKRLERRQAGRDHKNTEKQLKENNDKNEAMLKEELKKAEINFNKAMDEEDHVLAREYANEMKFYEKKLKEAVALKRHAARLTRLASTKANAIKTLELMKESTRLLKLQLAGQMSESELDKLVDSLEQDMEDILSGAKASEEIISDLGLIPVEDEVTEEELKAMKERYNASKAGKEGGIKAPEGNDKEIADMLSALGGNAGNA